jgi:hypothetical protein
MTIANRLVAQGYNRANAMVKAWALVKLPAVATKVAGVTFGNRQKAVQHLAQYAPEMVSIRLEREQGNEYDKNAVAVYAAVEGRGAYHMGYLPKALAALIAPLLDAGKAVSALFKEVRGGYEPYMNYGMALEVMA